MSKMSDHYPPLSGCDGIGIMGGCGLDCPVLLDGECPIEDEILEPTPDASDNELTSEDLLDLIRKKSKGERKEDDFDRAMDILK